MTRQNGNGIHIGVNITGVGSHNGAWRLPEADAQAGFSLDYFVRVARLAERGLIDAFFLSDVPRLSPDVETTPQHQSFDPLVLLSALAQHTERIGLVATISTTWHHPYNLARSLLSVDRVSNGRVGWNIVTNHTPAVALNYGLDTMIEKAERYARASEFVEVVLGLWQTWAPDAVVADKARGVFAERGKVRGIDYEGRHFRVRGGSAVPPSAQGYPVILQAGASPHGLELAARFADAVFVAASERQVAVDYRKKLAAARSRVERSSPAEILVMPGVTVNLASTDEEAHRRRAELDELGDSAHRLEFLAGRLGLDPATLDLDKPIDRDRIDVERQYRRNSEGFVDSVLHLVDQGRTVREILRTGAGHTGFVGTPRGLADKLEHWYRSGAADGFNLGFDVVEEGLAAFVDEVVPILQERGLYRADYQGTTLRDHLGLPTPPWRPSSAGSRGGAGRPSGTTGDRPADSPVTTARLVLESDERLRAGRQWLAGLPATTSRRELEPLLTAEPAPLSPVESWGVALELGHRGEPEAHLLGTGVARARLADPELRRPYATVWATAVSVGALLRWREVAAHQVTAGGAAPTDDPLTLERLGRVDAIAWAGATALDALVEEAAGQFAPGSGGAGDQIGRRIAATAAAVANLAAWTQHDLVPGEAQADPYLDALTYFLASTRALPHSYLQQAVGRHLLTGEPVFAADRGPLVRAGNGRNQ
ncbi:NtaA/DmoA family FMN-dependent monooxygenase [Acrocarpospora catenulata]|uniref:NtaA/DmoA family FMN-dependent monooxygenase n=1 Tax=Acrocarpospora catenulata TaxID=2836182 RepID=UPI001BD97C74|nr:NtaA/DmoA family FMN-dependent monooxygenase [Acrocarpospora catenulata]